VSPLARMLPIKAVEFAKFGSRLIIVNHRSSPVNITDVCAKRMISQIPSGTGWLAAHSAMLLEVENNPAGGYGK
jgi:hypothetical protein